MNARAQECFWDSRRGEPLVTPTCGKLPACPFDAAAVLACPFAASGRHLQAPPSACDGGGEVRTLAPQHAPQWAPTVQSHAQVRWHRGKDAAVFPRFGRPSTLEVVSASHWGDAETHVKETACPTALLRRPCGGNRVRGSAAAGGSGRNQRRRQRRNAVPARSWISHALEGQPGL